MSKSIREELEKDLYKLYLIKNMESYEGSIEKCECTIKGEKGIFKERIGPHSKDNVMEQVAYEIAQLVGVNCCKAYCRKSHGVYGSFSRFKVTDINNVYTYSKIMKKVDMDADELLYNTIKLNGNVINNFVITLYKYIIFDYILGQQDRHLENLPVYIVNKKITWYPLYDNGLSCFSMSLNDAAIQFLNQGFYSSRMGFSDDILRALNKYRDIIYKDDIRHIVKYHILNKEILLSIICRCDKYNQINKKRRTAMINFILRHCKDIDNLNLRRLIYE